MSMQYLVIEVQHFNTNLVFSSFGADSNFAMFQLSFGFSRFPASFEASIFVIGSVEDSKEVVVRTC